jgi:hypothetical protein
MEIPGYGLVEGQWDLRESAAAYLGQVKFAGKRVLELGKASGFLTFHMEREGAEVVAHDLSEHDAWDVVPFANLARRSQSDLHPLYPPGIRHWKDFLKDRQRGIVALNNGFWLAHRAFGSQARLVLGSVYDLPEALGRFEVATLGSILLHLRDPFQALFRASCLTRETLVVTDIEPDTVQHVPGEASATGTAHGACAKFVPDPQAGGPLDIWWQLAPELIVRWLAILGFEDARILHSGHRFQGHAVPLYTVVANRTVEMDSEE